MIKLKSCPFCGNEVNDYTVKFSGTICDRLEIECTCGVRITIERDPIFYAGNERYVSMDALAKWNRRATDQ